MILFYTNNFFEFQYPDRGENHIQCFGDHSFTIDKCITRYYQLQL
jgi:hypothetical protein